MSQRDIPSLSTPATPSNVDRHALGYAYGLSEPFTVILERPLHVSYDTNAKVLDMAIQRLKRMGDHDVKIAGIEAGVAWTCIASIMPLGPSFVLVHLLQFLVLWRNARCRCHLTNARCQIQAKCERVDVSLARAGARPRCHPLYSLWMSHEALHPF